MTVKVAKKKLRPVGDILLDMEELRNELLDHGYQWSDFFGELYLWLMVHAPSARETYEDDNSHPEFYYGPKRN